nr:AMP-binding protein [Deinococcus taeanensis]
MRASASALPGRAPLPPLGGLIGAVLRHGPTLAGTVAWHAGRRPEQLALCDGHTRLTYRQLHHRVQERVAALAPWVRAGWSVGLPPGEGTSYVVTLLAALRLGLQVTLLPPGLDTPGTQEHLRLRLILRAEEGEMPAPAVRFGPRAGRVRLLSSGSTGAPKPVRPDVGVLSALRVSRTLVRALGVRAGVPVLLPLPLWHGHGLATLALSLGLGSPLYLRPDARPDTLWQVLAQEQIEVPVLVPTILHRLLALSGKAPVLRSVVCGSAPLDPDLACRAAQRLGSVLFNLYGTTEPGLITLAGPQDLRASPDVVRRPLPGVRVRVAADGQVLVRGSRGWRPSGDLGQLDAGGAPASAWPRGRPHGDRRGEGMARADGERHRGAAGRAGLRGSAGCVPGVRAGTGGVCGVGPPGAGVARGAGRAAAPPASPGAVGGLPGAAANGGRKAGAGGSA